MNLDDSVGPSSKTIYSNDKLSKVEDDFHVFSELEDDINDGESREQKTQYHEDEHDSNDDIL